MKQVKIKLLPGGIMPVYSTPGAAGADLFAAEEYYISHDQYRATISTGICFEIPEGYEGQIRGRSGLAFRQSFTVFNGTIDSDYRGVVRVLLINQCKHDLHILKGDRIAQIVIKPVEQFEFINAVTLRKTERGAGGFGSTGK